MGQDEQRKVLLILPRELLDATDEAAEILQISRLGFIRQAIARNLVYFHRNDKQQFCLPNDCSG